MMPLAGCPCRVLALQAVWLAIMPLTPPQGFAFSPTGLLSILVSAFSVDLRLTSHIRSCLEVNGRSGAPCVAFTGPNRTRRTCGMFACKQPMLTPVRGRVWMHASYTSWGPGAGVQHGVPSPTAEARGGGPHHVVEGLGCTRMSCGCHRKWDSMSRERGICRRPPPRVAYVVSTAQHACAARPVLRRTDDAIPYAIAGSMSL